MKVANNSLVSVSTLNEYVTIYTATTTGIVPSAVICPSGDLETADSGKVEVTINDSGTRFRQQAQKVSIDGNGTASMQFGGKMHITAGQTLEIKTEIPVDATLSFWE